MAELLFLAHRIPFPPDRGDKIRSWNLLRHLAQRSRVHLACFADDEADAAHLAGLRAVLGDRLGEVYVGVRSAGRLNAAMSALRTGRPLSLALFDSPEMRAFVGRILARAEVDTVFAFSGQMAQFVPEGTPQRFLMDFGDVDSAKFESYADGSHGPMRWVYRREARMLGVFESAVAARADASLFVSEAEASLFRERSGQAGIAIQNGVDLDYFSVSSVPAKTRPEDGRYLLFTGQMDYRPNIDAVSFFARDVLPILRAGHPDLRFLIAGRHPAPAVRKLEKLPGIVVTGAVPDMRAWLAAAEIVVAPLRIARGIQNKVLEAMAMGRPVVATPAAFEGIDAEPGRDLLVAEGASAQASAVLGLLDNPARAAAIGAAARLRMERAYSWDAKLAPLASLLGDQHREAAE